MLSFFRRVSKSRIGTWIMSAILLAILAGFAMSDISNFGTGNIGLGGMSGSTLAEVGDQKITDRDMSDAMQRRLAQVRQTNAQADYSTIAADFEPVLAQLIDQRALLAFANKYGFAVSKRQVDAQIAQLPGVRGLNGQVSVQGYQQFLAEQRMTDQQVREIITTELLERLLLTPVASNARTSVGVATPYASMLLEAREGQAVVVPITPFRAGLNPSDADLQRFYTANRARYTVPEQRVARFALIGPQQVAEVAATDQEIAAYYNANQATYGPRDSRVLSQVVVPDQATAAGIAARAKAGATLAAAAAPAGSNAAVTSLGEQSRPAYAGVAGDKVAAAVFSAPSGAVVGPVQSDFGWVVVKVESVKAQAARPLAAVKGEIATKLSADKRKQALDDLINRVQDALDDGQNFAEAAASAKLPVTTTPLVMADGKSRTDASYRLPAEFAPALKTTFEIAPNDPPEIVTLAGGQSNAMVSPAEVVPATPAPLASIRDRVVEDWVAQQALNKARSVASAIATKASAGSIEDAVRQAGVALPPVRPVAGRRIQIAQATGPISAVMRMLFTLTAGKSRIVPDPDGRGFIVVKVEKIVPGNALLQPGLISQMQSELQQATSQDYARQFLTAVREQLKVRRNESAIASAKERLSGS